MNAPLAARPSDAGLEWAQRLVRFDTVSRHPNRALIDCIADELRALHVPLRLTHDDSRTKWNLFATVGEGAAPGVVLSGHTDTVPWDGQAWTVDPLGAQVQEHAGGARLTGRGSADMKGFIGLVVARTAAWQRAALPFPIHYAFSADEETGCFGVRHLLADLREAGVAPRLCLIGEPTGMLPARAHKGVYRWCCRVKGRPAHSSLAPKAVNAIEAAARVVAHIADLGDGLRAEGPFWPGFDVPHSTTAVGVIEGGIADNVVPEDCRFHYEVRNLPGVEAEALHERVRARAAALEPAMRAVAPEAGFAWSEICAVPAFLAEPGDPAVRLALRLTGAAEATLVPFGTEAGLFQRAGIATVVCGPGFVEQAHQPDEFVSFDQLARCESMLAALGALPSLEA
jgi:acetylornithine deacetylase